jgi:(p)ppGpp synthase/HD superfamily hydrolase
LDKLSEAICFATAAFDGMERKGDRQPAILHSLEAATITQTLTDEKEAVIAAVLHDTVEDAGVKIGEIIGRFGDRVAHLVLSETENKRIKQNPSDTWQMRKEESVAVLTQTDDIGIKALYLGDKLSNLRSLYRSFKICGDGLWDNFNQKDPAKHKWYYMSIRDALGVFSDKTAYKEYCYLVDKLFEGTNNDSCE